MIELFKTLFGKKKNKEYIRMPPGRTFNRILTGRYFGCEDGNADERDVVKAKQEKIDQIKELGLAPMSIRYTYKNENQKNPETEENKPLSAHVAFQKEVFAEKWNMVHITEISFIVYRNDFKEFEKISGVRLEDFRDLSSITFKDKDRRKEKRDL